MISEEKRLRDEQEAALAAQKAKESEFNDMKSNLNEAKTAKANADAALKALQKLAEDCAADSSPAECAGATDDALAAAQADFDFESMNYAMVNEAFSYVAEELKLKEDEATARAIQKQRTAVVNMVKNDVKVIQKTIDRYEERIEWTQKNALDVLLANEVYRCQIPSDTRRRL